jgi:hypothetical protein
MEHVPKPEHFKRHFHRRIVARVDPRQAVVQRPVPRIDLPQLRDKIRGRPAVFQGRVALAVFEDQQPGRMRPCAEIESILRRIDLRLAVGIAAEAEVVDIAVCGGELAGDPHAVTCARAVIAITQSSR